MRASQRRKYQLAQLLKLHQKRVKACESRYHEAVKERDKAAEDVHTRQASITQLETERSDLFRYLDEPAVLQSPAKVERVHVRRYWVEYDLEKHEYYLDLDQQALEEADEQLKTAKADWLRARYRESGVQNMYRNTLREIALSDEQMQEMESEDAQSVFPLGGVL
jgi:chromosome segregation ATPase